MTSALIRYGEHPKVPPGSPCEACGDAERQPVTDHCHKHIWVRAVICQRCNMRMKDIDRRIIPAANTALLLALLDIWRRCPECAEQGSPELRNREPKQSANVHMNLDTALHDAIRRYATGHGLNFTAAISVLAARGLRDEGITIQGDDHDENHA